MMSALSCRVCAEYVCELVDEVLIDVCADVVRVRALVEVREAVIVHVCVEVDTSIVTILCDRAW